MARDNICLHPKNRTLTRTTTESHSYYLARWRPARETEREGKRNIERERERERVREGTKESKQCKKAIFTRWRFIYREFIRFSCTSERPAADTAVEKVSAEVDVDTICNTWLIREGIHGTRKYASIVNLTGGKKRRKQNNNL